MVTENVSTLKIHRLTQAQYDRELEAGTLDENALYLTPDEMSDLATALADAPDITINDGMFKVTSTDGTQYMSMSQLGFVILDNSKVMSIMSDTIQFVGTTTGKITGLATPTGDNYAANKKYVDDAIAALEARIAALEGGSGIPLTIVGTGDATNCAITVGGKTYYTEGSYTVNPGDVIGFVVTSTAMLSANGENTTFSELDNKTWTIPDDATSVEVNMSWDGSMAVFSVTSA